MDSKRWDRIQRLFEEALELPREKRRAFLLDQTNSDQDLVSEVERLLAADEADDDTLLNSSALAYVEKIQLEDESEIGPYRIISELGKGGMGVVYLAERADGLFEQKVALKVIKKGIDTESIIQRFNQERQILARLNHPNIAQLLDGGLSEDGRPYFALEYIEGESIVKYADDRKLSVNKRLELFQSVCDAVHYAHQNLVVHRDIKPSNILVTEEGTVKLLDFGISKILDDDDDLLITKTGQALLTPSYASPEQLREERVTTSTDIYSLGVILYELLAGRRPFAETRSIAEIKNLVLSKDPTLPSDLITQIRSAEYLEDSTVSPDTISKSRSTTTNGLKKSLAGDLDNICLMALRKEPVRRYKSAENFREDIARHLIGQTVSARKDTTNYRLQKFVRRHRVGVIASSIGCLLFLFSTAYYTTNLSKERDKAIFEQERTEEVVNFVTGLFNNSDPNVSKGEDVTAREMLMRGSQQIDEELADQPEIQSSLKMVIGEILVDLGIDGEGKKLLEESVDQIMKLDAGKPSGKLATALTLAGIANSDAGNHEIADSLYLRALKMRKKLFGEISFEVAESTQNFASLRQDQGEYPQADSLFRRVVEINRQLYPNGDQNLTESLTDLGSFLRLIDNDEEAEQLLREALDVQKKIYDGRHLEIASTQKSLASVLRAKGEYDEAELLYWDALATRRQLLGNNHTAVANVLDSHSKLKSYIGQMDSTLIFQSESLKIMENIFGSEPNFRIAPYYNNHGMILKDLGRYEESIESLKKSIAILDATSAADNMNKSYPLTGIGNMYRSMGQLRESEDYLRQAVALREKKLDPDHRHLLDSQSDLGSTLIQLNRYREAEELLLNAYKVFVDKRGFDDNRTQKAIRRLVRLYTMTQNEEKRKEYEGRITSK